MIKTNKRTLIITSVIILLPVVLGLLLWNRLPDQMTVHWGGDGNVDGTGSKAFSVFGLPLIFLAIHWLCVIVTANDKSNKDQSRKAVGMVLWIIPFMSVLLNGLVYAYSLGHRPNMITWTLILIGAMFIVFGNYMPKCKQNHTIGVKIKWTLESEANWSATHRLTGKLWVIGGLVIAACAFLPVKVAVWVVLVAFVPMIAMPMIYSYSLHKKQLASGENDIKEIEISRTGRFITAVSVPLILIFCALICFTGNVKMQYGDDSFTIEATYYENVTVSYADVDSVEYSESFDAGIRTFGFGSPRLSLGTFENDEFGAYTLYAYTACDAAVIVTVDEKVLVISGKDADATKAIYDEIKARTE